MTRPNPIKAANKNRLVLRISQSLVERFLIDRARRISGHVDPEGEVADIYFDPVYRYLEIRFERKEKKHMKDGLLTPVYVNGALVAGSDHWHVEDGYLTVYDFDNERLATFAPGAWQRVAFHRPEAV